MVESKHIVYIACQKALVKTAMFFAVLLLVNYVQSVDTNQHVLSSQTGIVCVTQTVPYEVRSVSSSVYSVGSMVVEQEGVQGVRSVCSERDRIVSNDVTVVPIPRIVAYGTART